ncbi:hypothetical protein [Sorangium sp. So ce1151]|uniref:hypothetical protein n=1 Tax=Sorangium sp. So ce1151 TaxID=3133332 RepID=UPI003F5D5B20
MAQPAQASALELAKDPVDDGDEDPQPSDPQCGACASYVTQEQRLYVFVREKGVAPYVRLDFYSQSGGLVATYALQPWSSGGGKMIYSISGGPGRDAAALATMSWPDQNGALHQIGVAIRSTWLGWNSMDQ